ncbi:DNA helicase [Malassezia yamatoensis]|uniref:DNA 3'-5' helicase n=1 Tax=Malassezia yamatoensis TaxID=253288 RepID=A0AAJ5YW04_9BASI|nr:DNA helicase [Malassezia yamatoensis]
MPLSASQREAIEADAGCPLQILAGPGSGKTRVLTMRVAWIMGDESHAAILPENCVVVTFTNKAANEMRLRLTSLIGPDKTQKLVLGTFHALCAMYLRKYGHLLGIENNFTIADTDDTKRIMKQVLEEMPDVPLKPEQALSEISRAKSRGQSVEDVHRLKDHGLLADLYAAYQDRLRSHNALDFDDLLMRGLHLFSKHPSVGRNISHVLVDEFQDTNAVQYNLMRCMASASGHVSIVGDPDQSIYSWRNAEVGNLEKMLDDFPNVRRVYLEENFRSTQAILDASIKVMRQDTLRIDKNLHTAQGIGAPVSFHTFSSAESEAEYIALEIQRNVQLARPMIQYADICILLRFNALSRTLETAFQRQRIPYRVIGGPKFFDRTEVKDLLAYLLLVDNPTYTPALLRIINVPRRGVGVKSVKDLSELAHQYQIPLYSCIEQIVDGNTVFTAGMRGSVVSALQGLFRCLRKVKDAAYERMEVNELLQLLITELDYQTHLQREDDAESRWQNIQELISFAASTKISETPSDDTPLENSSREYNLVSTPIESLNESHADAKESTWKPVDQSDTTTLDLQLGTDETLTDSDDGPTRKRVKVNPEDPPIPLRVFLENSMLATDTEAGVKDNDKVTISTCHAAKGLEWPVVFVPAVENGTFPFYRSVSPDEQREERRLLYVAMTRAATNLYLSYTTRRLVAGEWQNRSLSTFLAPLLSRSQTSSNSSDSKNSIDWCFGQPDIVGALKDAAKVLHRDVPDEQQLKSNQAEFSASTISRRLSMIAAEWKPVRDTNEARLSQTSCVFQESKPRQQAPGGFASALNALSSSALSGGNNAPNARAAFKPPSQINRHSYGQSMNISTSSMNAPSGLLGTPKLNSFPTRSQRQSFDSQTESTQATDIAEGYAHQGLSGSSASQAKPAALRTLGLRRSFLPKKY